MKMNKKALAIFAGLTMAMSGSAFAASADDFTDVPKDHWAYQALDYLAQEGVIEGMGDSTFQGGRSMSRYEMAAIVAKAMQKNPSNIGDQAVLEKLQGEFGTEIKRLTKRVDAHDKAIKDLQAKQDKFKVWGMGRVQVGDDNGLISDGRHGTYNNRFYMDLEGSMKVNDRVTARFTIEKNAHYRDSEYKKSKIKGYTIVPRTWSGTSNNGTTYATAVTVKNSGTMSSYDIPISGVDQDSLLGDDNHNGSISNIWVEMQLGPQRNWYTNIGRKWNGIGMQNLMLGGQVDGIQTYHPIENGHGWWMSAQYWKSASDWTEMGAIQYDAWDQPDGTIWLVPKAGAVNCHRAPVIGTLNFWGPLGKYIDLNVAYSRLVQHKAENLVDAKTDAYYTGASNWIGVDMKVRPLKDFSITGSYLKSDAKRLEWDTAINDADWVKGGHNDRTWMVRFDYRNTDLNKKGSWSAYAKWADIGALSDIAHDDEWATREPTYVNGVRGWYFGFKCVPAQNVEWETMWAPNLRENIQSSDGGYKRHILRSWLDYHF